MFGSAILCLAVNGDVYASSDVADVSKGDEVASLAEAQAGDIVCYANHVAIYDGHGMLIEAKGSKWGITHDRSADYAEILTIRRFT